MTDAERAAKAWCDLLGVSVAPAQVERFQRLIDSGVITVAPPPDPAEQIHVAYQDAVIRGDRPRQAFARLIADGWIVPGPRCEGYEPQPDPLAQGEGAQP